MSSLRSMQRQKAKAHAERLHKAGKATKTSSLRFYGKAAERQPQTRKRAKSKTRI